MPISAFEGACHHHAANIETHFLIYLIHAPYILIKFILKV